MQRLEHAGGFFATGHAEIEPLFLSQEDGVGIILTIVPALAAVLLAHGRHHPTAQGPPFGELHALVLTAAPFLDTEHLAVLVRICTDTAVGFHWMGSMLASQELTTALTAFVPQLGADHAIVLDVPKHLLGIARPRD